MKKIIQGYSINSRFKDYSLIEKLIFITGLCSTIQVTGIFGVTWFTFFVFLLTIILLINDPKISFGKNRFPILYLMMASISELMVLSIPLYNKQEWMVSSFKKYVLLISLVVFFYKIVQLKKIDIFLKGLYASCLLEVVWCYLQLLLHFKGIMINSVLFNASEYSSQGHLALTGLNTNAGILVPAVVFAFYYSQNYIVKLLCLGNLFLSGNTTMMICGLFVLLLMSKTVFKMVYNKISIKKKNIYIILVFIVVLVFASYKYGLNERIGMLLGNLLKRISSVNDLSHIDGSTYAHARYYTSILDIWSSIGIHNVFFGFGIGCAGVPFVQVFNQYPDIVYVPESDMVTYLYDYGLVGMVVFFTFLTILFIKLRKKSDRMAYFVLAIFVSGFFYGMQLNWVILTEWFLYYLMSTKSVGNMGIESKEYFVK